jgi:hypothetical protein
LKQADSLSEKILANALGFIMVPLAVYSTHVTQVHYLGLEDTAWSQIIMIALVLLFMIYLGYSLFKSLNQRRQYQLGFDGERYVGQELNQLMLQGYRVFHDFPAEGFNIDHVLVGPSGVYAVETKARRKPRTSNASEDATVYYDGQTLSFPQWKETQPIDQAIRQAKWLAKWLTQATGEDIKVKALLALPGWYVKKTSREGIWVGNPKMLKHQLPRESKKVLSEKKIQAICHQLNQRCRDVEPMVSLEYSWDTSAFNCLCLP